MARSPLKLIGNITMPRAARSGLDVLRWAEDVNRAIREIRDLVVPGSGRSRGGGSSVASTCPFGEIITIEGDSTFDKGIRGGIVYCGDKNFNVPFKGIDLDSDSDKLIFLKVACESNRDDDHEMILPGIKTSSETSPAGFWQDMAWSETASYPDNTNPGVASGIGTIRIPIGRLTVKDGSAKLDAAGCGHVKIEQCGGILTHTRG